MASAEPRTPPRQRQARPSPSPSPASSPPAKSKEQLEGSAAADAASPAASPQPRTSSPASSSAKKGKVSSGGSSPASTSTPKTKLIPRGSPRPSAKSSPNSSGKSRSPYTVTPLRRVPATGPLTPAKVDGSQGHSTNPRAAKITSPGDKEPSRRRLSSKISDPKEPSRRRLSSKTSDPALAFPLRTFFEEEEVDDDDDDDDEEDEVSDLSAEEEVADEDEEEEDTPEAIEKALEELKEAAAGISLERPPEEPYRGDWTDAPQPGFEGFSSFAVDAMRKAGIASESLGNQCEAAAGECPPLQPHQESAIFLAHPQSPVTRLLVDHPTGSGKTREIIEILDNFFDDPRPKIPIFPKDPVCRNFYAELLRWPSKYRDYFCCLMPEQAAVAAQVPDWRMRRTSFWTLAGLSEEVMRGLCKDLRDILEMKGAFFCGKIRPTFEERFKQRFPGELLPAAPLRALRYTSAGGAHAKLRDDGNPVSSLFKIGFQSEGGNVYSNKVVVMDEAHNLVRSQTQYQEQLSNLRELLFSASGTVLAGFTGTPILGDVSEGRRLLDVIKGKSAMDLNDEGFLSSFHMRPQPLFPHSLPKGLPDAVLTPKLRAQFVRKVVLQGEPLQRYDQKRRKDVPERRLRAYCNMCVHFGSFHAGISGTRHRVLNNFAACAPKLHALAKDVAAVNTKALVLIAKNTGLEALVAHLQELGRKSVPSFNVATMDDLAAFNSAENLRGEKFRVLVADALTCSEGVSFFAVRRVLLADVPATPSAMVQSVGRAIRLFGHRGLPAEEQTVTTSLYISGFPRWMRSSLAAWAFRVQKRHQDPREAESKARRLLRTLRRVGINTLADLKGRLDARKKTTQGAQVDGTDGQGEERQLTQEEETAQATGLLEAIGLWDEARAVRELFKEQMRRRQKRDMRSMQSDPRNRDDSSRAGITPKARRALRRAVSDAIVNAAQGPPPPPRTLGRHASDASEATIGFTPMIGTPRASPLSRPLSGDVMPSSSPRESPRVALARRLLGNPEAELAMTPLSMPKLAKDEALSAMSPAESNAMVDEASAKPQTTESAGAAAPTDKAGGAPAAAAAADAKPTEGGPAKGEKPTNYLPPAFRRHYLVSALLSLQAAQNLEEVERAMSLNLLTADEEALRSLAARTKELAPALMDLRSRAVDREVLLGIGSNRQADDEEAQESDGESCYSTFGGLDEHSDREEPRSSQASRQRRGGKASPKQRPPVILPPGWRTERVMKGRRESTQFIAPDGTRYHSQGQARAKINAEWRARNISDSLKSKFEDRLKQRQTLRLETLKVDAPPEKKAAGDAGTSSTAQEPVSKAAPLAEEAPVVEKRRRLTKKTNSAAKI
eukprot:TRINITY_DN1728_c0_g1_i1.p1 TRINITY_DN1728_c0_g1~~TRINITY_DN1728_c0_g1_i1.p1  ORF type:complete len:1361 (-),score=330.68 TRINITY_DN1728_c0_g1_i1:38-4078(-)